MSNVDENKEIVGRWFTEFWGKTCNLGVVDELASPDMLLQYSLHEPRRGRAEIKAFMTDFRAAFPDLNFWGVADLIAEGDYITPLTFWHQTYMSSGRALADCFPEMRPYLGRCRFGISCRHQSEPGCAVRQAVANGAIHPARYDSYQKLVEEI